MKSRSPFQNDYYEMTPKTGNNNTSQTSKSIYQNLYYSNQTPKQKYQYGMFSKRYIPKDGGAVKSSRIGASRVSNNQSYMSNGMQEQKLYSQELLFLLSEEENNIKYFKQKLQSQKARVNRDFNHFKTQLAHILDDLHSSFLAELDNVYKTFINKYRTFKEHMLEIREIRRYLMEQLSPNSNDYLERLKVNKNAISNRDLLGEITKDIEIDKVQGIYSEISIKQRERVILAKAVASQIISLGDVGSQFYCEGLLTDKFKKITELFQEEVKTIYPQIKYTFVKTSSQLIAEGDQCKPTNNILQGLSHYDEPRNEQMERRQIRSVEHGYQGKSFSNYQKEVRFEEGANFDYKRPSSHQKKPFRPVSNSTDANPISSASRKTYDNNSAYSAKKRNYHMGSGNKHQSKPFKITPEQQTLVSEWIEDLSLREVSTIDASQSNDALLCGVFANDAKHIVVGGKDKVLRVYEVSSGKLIYALAGHSASIVCMANFGSFVASGGDVPCNSLILWNSKSWNMMTRIQLHTAALSSILDLSNGSQLATSSYDAKENGLISDVFVDKEIPIGGVPSCMRPLSLKNNYVVVGIKQDKPGKLILLNILSNEILKKFTLGSTPIVDLILFQRQTKSEAPLSISCLSKQKSLMLTKFDTGVNGYIDVRGKLQMEYGCGIGPKIIMSQSGLMAIVSQSSMNREILIYQIGLI